MLFLPQKNDVAEQDARAVIEDLKQGKAATLLSYLKKMDSGCSSGAMIFGLILLERDQLNWIFSLEELEKEIFSHTPNFSKDQLISLRPHFIHARKFAGNHGLENAYYSNGTNILWNRFFEDLEGLPIDKNSHFYLNLRQYLELGSYQSDQKKPEMISKILFPFYKHLKDNPVVPFPFLVEILKIILVLNPRHAKAILEYVVIQRRRGDLSALLETLCHGFEKGVRDREFLIILMRECLEQSQSVQLAKISRTLFGSRIPNLDSEFFEEVREILYEASLYIEALFYGLKAFSFRNQDQTKLAPLRKIFYALGNLPFGEFCHFQSRASDKPNEIALILNQNLSESGLLYKFRSLQNWVEADHPFIFIEGGKNPKIELFHPSIMEPMIFYPPGHGPYVLKRASNSSKLVIEELAVGSPGEPMPYRYLDFEFLSSPEELKSLTPFKFLESKKEG